MRTAVRPWSVGALLLALGLAGVPGASGQDAGPLSRLVIAGYGSATYDAAIVDEYPNDFVASFSPVFLYNLGNDILFETELEFGLSGDLTTTTLEYAQIDYLGFERAQVIAGKFLLPFGVFGERLHPTWVNKLPTSPVLYGHAHGGVAEGALLPVLSDAGVMVRYAYPWESGWGLDLSLYVVQGPRVVEEDHASLEGGGDSHADRIATMAAFSRDPTHDDEAIAGLGVPPVGFGVSFSDNNKNKMLGGRLGLLMGPSLEVYVSGFHAMYDAGSFLDYQAGALSLEWRRGPFELRTEGVVLQQEFVGEDAYETLSRKGYYVQAARRIGAFEPVVRWGQLLEATVAGEKVSPGLQTLALGIDYWVDVTVPVKLAYQFTKDADDRVILQWAFGF